MLSPDGRSPARLSPPIYLCIYLFIGVCPWRFTPALLALASAGCGRSGRALAHIPGARAQETPLHGDGEIAQGSRGAAGAGWVLGRIQGGGCWCPWRRFGDQERVEGRRSVSRWGSGSVPGAPDYLSISPLGTRTGSERGGRPGRPNWRPSQTVKLGECWAAQRGCWGGGLAQHGAHCHPPWHLAPPPVTTGAYTGSRIGAPTLGASWCCFQRRVPSFHQETGSHRLQPPASWHVGPLQRETEARKDLSSFQALCQGQSLIPQTRCSGGALH